MAMNLNKVMLIGNLTRDPESRTIPSGQTVATYSVATNRRWTDQKTGEKREASEFHNCVAWGKLAEISQQYLKKGGKVYIEGRLQTRSWDDPTGVKKYRTEIVVENMIMLDRPDGSRSSSPTGSGMEAGAAKPSAAAKPAAAPEEEEINVEDIPF